MSENLAIYNWLIRVDTQYDIDTPERVKKVDHIRARGNLGSGNVTNITNNYFSSPSWGLLSGGITTNSNNTTIIDRSTHIHNKAPVKREEAKDAKETKERKPDWKGIVAVAVVSTAIAGISLFVYARIFQAEKGAKNYLKSTKEKEGYFEDLTKVAQVQEKIDQRALDKITNYKYSVVTSLVGTLLIAGGGITIFASAPAALATAATTMLVAGVALDLIAIMYAAYNCGMHWSDEKEGKREFAEVKGLIPKLKVTFEPKELSAEYQRPPAQNPDYINQVIYNERAGIYPDLSQFVFSPSAPSAEN